MLPWGNNKHKLTIKLKLSFLFGDRTIEQAASSSVESKALSMHVWCLICERCSIEFLIKIKDGRNEESITYLNTHSPLVIPALIINDLSANAHIFSRTFSTQLNLGQRQTEASRDQLTSWFYDRRSRGRVGTCGVVRDEVDIVCTTICVIFKKR